MPSTVLSASTLVATSNAVIATYRGARVAGTIGSDRSTVRSKRLTQDPQKSWAHMSFGVCGKGDRRLPPV